MSRFVIREISGYQIVPGRITPGSGSPGLSVTVLDSAYCYQIVRSWRTEALGGPMFQKLARMRREAAALVATLEAEAGAT